MCIFLHFYIKGSWTKLHRDASGDGSIVSRLSGCKRLRSISIVVVVHLHQTSPPQTMPLQSIMVEIRSGCACCENIVMRRSKFVQYGQNRAPIHMPPSHLFSRLARLMMETQSDDLFCERIEVLQGFPCGLGFFLSRRWIRCYTLRALWSREVELTVGYICDRRTIDSEESGI